jgi:hypothetical protein
VFITHGEPDAADAFADLLRKELHGTRVVVAKLGEGFDLES